MRKFTFIKSLMLVMLMMVSMGAWADEVTLGGWASKPISGSNSTSVNGTLTDSGSNSWSVSLTGSDAEKNPSQSVYTGTTYWQLGAKGNMTTAVFSTSAIPGTITKIVVDCAAYSGNGTANVTVGGSDFGTQGQTMPSWTGSAGGKLTFTGSASGEIIVTLTPTTGGRAIYLSSITVTYAAGNPKKVTYSDGGSDTETSVGAGVTLPTRPNLGDYFFRGWSVTNISTETTTAPEILTGNYKPSQDITLYPVYARVDGEDGTPSVKISDYATANNWQGSGAVAYTSITLDDNITVTTTGTGNNGKYYSDWRLYQNGNGNAIVTAKNGALLKSATFTFTIGNTGALLYDEHAITSGTAVQLNGTSATFTVGNTGSATNGQVKITEIAVEYAIGTTYYISVPPVATIPLNAACHDTDDMVYGTYSNSSAWVVPSELDVFVIAVEGETLLAEPFKIGEVVPANTGVLVSALEGGNYVVTLSNEAGVDPLDGVYENALRPTGNGITPEQMAAADADKEYFRLTMHDGTSCGFWWGAENGAAFALGANKAYLVAEPAAAGAKGFSLGQDAETAISAIKAQSKAVRYNLAGQRVDAAYKGIVIVNGKKVVK